MHTEHCKHKGCESSFTKTSRGRAIQALQMHVGRAHSGIIKTPTGPQNGKSRQHAALNGNGNGYSGVLVVDQPAAAEVPVKLNGNCRFTQPELTGILGFLRTRRNEFTTKTACFEAALKANGAEGRIVSNSVAVNRYFHKAEETRQAHAVEHVEPSRRKYTKRNKSHHAQPERQAHGAATLTSPTINLTFSAEFLPEVLHSIAFSMSGKKGVKH